LNLRAWQVEALPIILANLDRRPMVRGVMGSGKSVLIAELCRALPSANIMISTPTVKLVEQLAETVGASRYYTHAKDIGRVTVVCHDSLDAFADTGTPVDLWIADEAHKTENDSVKAAIERIAPGRRVGFSATPWRSSEREAISLFDCLIYDYGPTQAMRDGVVVPLQIEHYDGPDTDIDSACLSLIKRAKGPGIANAFSIADAENFAEFLSLRGVAALAIHSRLPRTEQAARIELLRTGDVRCLVHVNMLSEGVDLPWLKWLCARRPVSSRVRFAQEVGRVLRAAPEKTHATVYDIHDLFGALSLDYEACLSGGTDEPEPLKLAALDLDFVVEEIKRAPEPPAMVNDIPLVLIAPARSYIRKTTLDFQQRGLITMQIKSTRWRKDPPSGPQLELAWSLRHAIDLPMAEHHHRALDIAWHALPGLNKGDVSDMIGILKTLQQQRGWPRDDEEKQSARQDLGSLHLG
jgi:tRNA A37 threonylcarbamoyladenosine biosynthesis protein TsaE